MVENFTASLFLYNPLEAMILVLFLTTINRDKFRFKHISFVMTLGTVNLLIQSIDKLICKDFFVFAYDTVVSLVFMPVTLYFTYFYMFNRSPRITRCFFACCFNFITIFIGLYLVEKLDLYEIVYIGVYANLISELYINLFIKALQIVCLYFIKFGVWLYYEKISKDDCY